MTSASRTILDRIKAKGASAKANENISEHLVAGDWTDIEAEVQAKAQDLLNALVIDTADDHNTKETAKRIAKMFVRELFSGRYNARPDVTDFPNAANYDQLYVVGPCRIISTCAHHFQPITGSCWVGVYPGKQVIGLSKFQRLIDWISSRPTIQEELTHQIAEEIQKATDAVGIAVILKAEHGCMINRGVKIHASNMVTSVLRGKFLEDVTLKQEFIQLVTSSKGYTED